MDRKQRLSFPVLAIAAVFTVYFGYTVIPPLVRDPDILGAFAAGFVNPYSSGYSADIFACWAILAVWIVHDAKRHGVRHGWVCLVLGLVPGVAVGLAVYLAMRTRQLDDSKARSRADEPEPRSVPEA